MTDLMKQDDTITEETTPVEESTTTEMQEAKPVEGMPVAEDEATPEESEAM